MTSIISVICFVFCLCCIRSGYSDCSVSLPTYNVTSSTGNTLSGSISNGSTLSGIQLLFPSWSFSCTGTIDKWMAHVTGDTSIHSSIEFQIFQPDSVDDNVYHAVYGNPYRGEVVDNTTINVTVDNINTPRLPIRPDYIVGIYISSNVLNLLYDSTGDVDIYYWENTPQQCDLSLCNAQIIRGVNPLVGWIFRNITSVSPIEETLALIKQLNPNYCTNNISECVSVTSSISLEVTTSTGIEILATSAVLSTIVSSFSFMSTLLTSSPSITPSITPSTHIPTINTSTHISTIPTVTTELSMSSVFLTSTTSPTPTQSVTNPPPTSFFDNFTVEVLAAFGVVVVLFLVVLILTLVICICCLMKRKSSAEVSTTQSIENPDYTGAVSMSSIKLNQGNFTLSIKNGGPQPPLPSIPVETADVDYDDPVPSHNRYFELVNSTESNHLTTKLDTQRMSSSVDTRLSASEISPSPAVVTINKERYSVPRPAVTSFTDSLKKSNHSSPPPNESPPPPPSNPPSAYNTLTNSSQYIQSVRDIYDDPDEFSIPSTQDPEIVDTYDPIVFNHQKDRTDGSRLVYAYVPTQEQRASELNWRYEVPFDQEYNKLKFFVEAKTFWAPAATTSGLYEQLASNKYREILRKEIQIAQTVGEGQFGFVSRGIWNAPDGCHKVAIKMLKPEGTEDDRLKLLQEAAIMGQFLHKNIVKLHGVVTVGDPVLIILELMPRGDLRTYLRSIKDKINKMNSLSGLPKLLIKFCRDIASGMNYLSHKSFVHRDLAARNILLSADLTCKIGDFGMARDLMQDENNYYKSSGGIIPLKWTAPEALNFKKYTSSSDIWSYGMVLFEIWSLGHKPFNDLSNPIVIALINSKHCQPPPPGCSRAMYQLMVDCWNPEYSLRPPFDKVIDYLNKPDESLFKWSKEDLSVGKNVHVLGAPLEEASDLYVDLQRVYQQSMLEQLQKK